MRVREHVVSVAIEVEYQVSKLFDFHDPRRKVTGSKEAYKEDL